MHLPDTDKQCRTKKGKNVWGVDPGFRTLGFPGPDPDPVVAIARLPLLAGKSNEISLTLTVKPNPPPQPIAVRGMQQSANIYRLRDGSLPSAALAGGAE